MGAPIRRLAAPLAVLWLGCAPYGFFTGAGPASDEANTCADGIGPVPDAVLDAYGLDPNYYERHCSVYGVPVLGPAAVSDAALQEAGRLAAGVLAARQDVRDALHDRYLRIIVAASAGGGFRQVPELESASDRELSAAGLGPTPDFPAVVVRDSVIVCRPPWQDPDVTPPGDTLVHELGHAVLSMGLESMDGSFRKRLELSYGAALDRGTWRRTVPEAVAEIFGNDLPTDNYMMTNADEYWAVGVASFFGFKPIPVRYGVDQPNPRVALLVNEQVFGPDAIMKRDPNLGVLLEEAFPDAPNIPHHCPEWLEPAPN